MHRNKYNSGIPKNPIGEANITHDILNLLDHLNNFDKSSIFPNLYVYSTLSAFSPKTPQKNPIIVP